MVRSNQKRGAGRVRTAGAASRYDFIETLRMLGAELSVPHRCRRGATRFDDQPISLLCARKTWERMFGPMANVTCYFRPPDGFLHTWEHHWNGGCVRCVGRLVQRSADRRYVVVKRAQFFETTEEHDVRDSCTAAH